jgi:hypothetical protein
MSVIPFYAADDFTGDLCVYASDYDALEVDNQRLREAVREFAGYFSSDDPKHWELHVLADGSALTTANGEVT